MNLKILLAGVSSLVLLNSCVFESPFETEAGIPVDPALLGRWEEVPGQSDEEKTPDQMLILQHSANEFVVEYPIGEEAMYFRAFAVELAGGKYIQIQLIGSADKPLKAEDRKYHLLKVGVEGDTFHMSTIDVDVLGKDLKRSAQMNAAFAEHKDDPKLFGDPETFRRIK